MSLLRISNLSKSFGSFQALRSVNLQVKPGERHAIIGPNGAGKSTLMSVLTGRASPTSGEVFVNGVRTSGLPPHRIARLGVSCAFQIINSFPRLTVFENVRAAVLSRRRHRLNLWASVDRMHEITYETDSIVADFDLQDCRDTPVDELAYGEQRALEIAICSSLKPELMLLDEPCAGLNADDTTGVINLIKRVSHGRTLIMIEHDMDVVFNIADRITVLHHGSVIATDTPSDLRRNEKVKEAYLGSGAFVS